MKPGQDRSLRSAAGGASVSHSVPGTPASPVFHPVAPSVVQGGTAPTRRRRGKSATSGHTARLSATPSNPGAMSPEERMAELGSLLATALRRLRLVQEKSLAESRDVEAVCDSETT